MRSGCVVLHSGGMDSTTLLYEMVHRHGKERVVSLGVDYGQRHRKELFFAKTTASILGVDRRVVAMSSLADVIPGSSLTDRSVPVPHGHYEDESMRSTVVPNRNMILIAVATAVAIANDLNTVAYAAHGGDHVIYPDCRPGFLKRLGHAMELCHYDHVYLDAPFMEWDKAMIAKRGKTLGVPWEYTWTCYEGGEIHCGACGACVERREALLGSPDPTTYLND